MNNKKSEIAIGADHAGFKLKEDLKHFLATKYTVKDFGCFSEDSVDYPDIALALASDLATNKSARGILICGSGMGMSIAANKVPGIRAALCVNEEYARLARQHNNSNILCMGARFTSPDLAKKITETYLNTEFESGRHERRVKLMDNYLS